MPIHFEILPTILAPTEEACKEQLRVAETAAKWVQWDIMDGTLVKNKTWYDAEKVSKWKLHSKIELHLMVDDPVRVIDQWQDLSAVRRVIWHVEADIDHLALMERMRDSGREFGLAISPKTSLLDLTPYIDYLDTVLVMGVEPGSSGQTMFPETVERIRGILALRPEIKVGVDGGVNAQNLKIIAQAGARRFCMNSAFYSHPFPRDFLYGQLDSLSYLE